MTRFIILPFLLGSFLCSAQTKKTEKFKGSNSISVVKNMNVDSIYSLCVKLLLDRGYRFEEKELRHLTAIKTDKYTFRLSVYIRDSLVKITGTGLRDNSYYTLEHEIKTDIGHRGFMEMDQFARSLNGVVYYDRLKAYF